MKQKVIVTGAAGFVGRNLVPQLLKRGFRVTALVKNDQEKAHLANTKVKVEVIDLAKTGEWPKFLDPDSIVIHLAAEISSKNPQTFVRNNVVATRNLISFAKKVKIQRIIHFSSAAVTSIRLDDYAKTKKKQEELIIKSEIPYLVLRPSMMYGPTDDKNIGWLIKMAKSLPVIPLPGGGNFGRQPVYIGDVCEIVIAMISQKTNNKIYEVHGYEYVTLKEMIKEINKQFRIKKLALPVPIIFLKAAIAVQQRVLRNPKFTTDQIESLTSGEKFKGDDWAKLFGIIPTNFSKGLGKMKV